MWMWSFVSDLCTSLVINQNTVCDIVVHISLGRVLATISVTMRKIMTLVIWNCIAKRISGGGGGALILLLLVVVVVVVLPLWLSSLQCDNHYLKSACDKFRPADVFASFCRVYNRWFMDTLMNTLAISPWVIWVKQFTWIYQDLKLYLKQSI